jgi:hypothetical protein
MREIILSYWDSFFTDLIRPYRDEITAISMLIVAIFTVVLARVAWKQTRDARILQRANLDVKFGGVRDTPAGELVGRVDFKNVGHLPAQKLRWLVRLDSGGLNWRPPKIKKQRLGGRECYSDRRGVAERKQLYSFARRRGRRVSICIGASDLCRRV